MPILLFVACQGPVEEPPVESDDTDAPEVDPSAPADPEAPYAACASSGRGFWVEDETAEWNDRYTYDARGDWVVNRYDADADEVLEQGSTATRDEEGRMLVLGLDYEDQDEAPDAQQVYTYGEDGLMATYTWDSRADGTDEIVFTATYDEAGRRVLLTRDELLDGTIEMAWHTTWITADGVTTERQERVDDEGTVGAVEVRTWEAAGLLLTAAYDDDGDGVAEATYTYAYDETGRAISYVGDVTTVDGAWYDYLAILHYDEWGRDAGRNIDYYRDASDEFLVRRTYDCSE